MNIIMASVMRIFFLISACIYHVSCSQECSEGTFGQNCSGSCIARHCVNQSSCDPVSGICENGCTKEWQGLACLERLTDGGADDTAGHDTRVIALATAPAVLVVLILVLMAVLLIRMKTGFSKLIWTNVKRNVPDPSPATNDITSHGSTTRDHITASNVDSPASDYLTAINAECASTSGYITAIHSDSATTRDNIPSGITNRATASDHDYITVIDSDSATTRDYIQSGNIDSTTASDRDYITAIDSDSATTRNCIPSGNIDSATASDHDYITAIPGSITAMGHITSTNTNFTAATDHIYTVID